MSLSRTQHQLDGKSRRVSARSRFFTLGLCGLILAPGFCTSSQATNGGAVATAVDVAVARPISFAATVIGSALFVVSLPIALLSHSTKDTAHVLVEAPAKDTFTRPVGDLDDFMSYY